MSYICYGASTNIKHSTRATLSLEAARELAELAKSDIFPHEQYTDYEVAIWIIMRELIEYGENRYNYYKKIPKKKRTSQDLQ